MKNEIAILIQPMTVDQYLEFEENSAVRHAFLNGVLIPMPGTTDIHNEICFTIKSTLRPILNNPRFKIYVEGVKVQVLHEQDYTYPDVMITADPRDLEDHYIKRYPSVIFEVISKSSRVTDSVDKFIRYRNIASLQNYVLVDSEKMFVEVRVKNEDGEWRSFIYLSLDDEVHIPAVNASFKLEALYENITFAG